MAEISIDVASQLISNYVKQIIDKVTQGKKLNNQEYLILLVYHNIMYTDRRFTELKDYTDIELKDYVDEKFQEVDKRFESLENEVKELRNEINDIKAKLATIETRLNNMEKEIIDVKDLMKQILVAITQLVSVLAGKTQTS